MEMNYDFLEEMEDFLGGTFHQDIDSPEEAIEEFITESSIECLVFTVQYCEDFLKCDMTIKEKEDFIKKNTDIFFPSIELTPIKWLLSAVEQITEAINNK